MPVGRVYQAPTTTLNTVSRNTPVYGFNGIKTVSNSDLVITGKAVRSTKSKSKSPSPAPNTLSLSSSNSSISSKQLTTNGTKKLSRKSKSPSPRKTTQLKSSKNRTESKNDATVVEIDNHQADSSNSNNNNNNGNGIVNAEASPKQSRNSKATSINEDWNNNKKPSKTLDNDNGSAKDSTSTKSQNGYHKEESPKEETDGASNQGINGLRNIGNTCFMNSVIQCLSNTKPLMNYLAQDDYSREINTSSSSMKGSLVKAFATVIKGLWKVNGRVVDPSSLKGAIQRFAPRFSGYNQEDSQEFLRYLLEGLHEDVNRVTTRPAPINTEIDTSLSVSEQAMEAWKRYIRRDDSHLVDLFVGQLKSTLQCTHCNHESVTFEPFWDLSLGIPSRSGDVSLLECFDAFTKEETLDGDEMPSCEACKMRRKSTKRYTLYRLPKILVVHLKRFSPTERFRQKLSSVVSFPLSGFSLSRYTDSVTCSSYNCYAISNHSGTLSSGHYTAYAKHPNSGQWHLYNDTRVSKCSSSSVITNEAYLLFFELA